MRDAKFSFQRLTRLVKYNLEPALTLRNSLKWDNYFALFYLYCNKKLSLGLLSHLGGTCTMCLKSLLNKYARALKGKLLSVSYILKVLTKGRLGLGGGGGNSTVGYARPTHVQKCDPAHVESSAKLIYTYHK
ncbi:hypothetical protein POVWA2_031370 [Plasmodium ovale wallikeri]|uniref:Uncharacterized protein n=1 Tax=Plasmodium ovale wallikeri TaxID=864142 RepID=A0A1A8YXH2_PLAOA|nr:hypothetical protein POVWA1_031650 [Plasmodium ovale wallikeri]SBT36677.1 hypothetical protein POVWA2_031370 [Plasmodium ovale wallikeri]